MGNVDIYFKFGIVKHQNRDHSMYASINSICDKDTMVLKTHLP